MCEKCDMLMSLGINPADDSTVRIRNFGATFLLEQQSKVPPFNWVTVASGSEQHCIEEGRKIPAPPMEN